MTATEVFKHLQEDSVYSNYRTLSAYYSGKPSELTRASNFWKSNTCKNKVHVPIAASIASFSSDLLFGEPPLFYAEGGGKAPTAEERQARLDYILRSNNFVSSLSGASEICASLGDIYIKINWDTALLDCPILSIVTPECAYPEYEQGILTGIHFIAASKAETSGNAVNYTYEYYANGTIRTERYKGTSDSLGTLIDTFEINTGINKILAIHIQNKPNARMNYGKSDYTGLITLFDALDESYSSWVRDMQLGKARLIIPKDYLHLKVNELNENQTVWQFNKDDEIFVALDCGTNDVPITMTQAEIRSEQHKSLCDNLLERIVSEAGYSPQFRA